MSYGKKSRRRRRAGRGGSSTPEWTGRKRVYGPGQGQNKTKKRWKVRSLKTGKLLKKDYATRKAALRPLK